MLQLFYQTHVFHRILFFKCKINPVIIIILQILKKMDRITRVECKKERDNDKSILEEEEDTLKKLERTLHFGRYLRYMIDYSFRVVNKLFQIMMMEFSKYVKH